MNLNKTTTLLFSHGFGIRKDNLGLFTFLSSNFKKLGYETVLFDYYKFNSATQEIITIPFSKQAQVLQKQIDKIRKNNPNKKIVIIGHSQGSIVPTLCDISSVSKVIGISPFFLTDKELVYERYCARAESTTDFDKISRRKHSDGTTTIIYPKYWHERFNTNQYDLYNKLAEKTSLTLIYGLNDKLALQASIKSIKKAKLISIPADHDFTCESRKELYDVLVKSIVDTKHSN